MASAPHVSWIADPPAGTLAANPLQDASTQRDWHLASPLGPGYSRLVDMSRSAPRILNAGAEGVQGGGGTSLYNLVLQLDRYMSEVELRTLREMLQLELTFRSGPEGSFIVIPGLNETELGQLAETVSNALPRLPASTVGRPTPDAGHPDRNDAQHQLDRFNANLNELGAQDAGKVPLEPSASLSGKGDVSPSDALPKFSFKWANIFRARTYMAPAIVAGVVGVLAAQLHERLFVILFWPIFAVLVLVMLFGEHLECPYCRKRLISGSKRCGHCGAAVNVHQ